MTMLPAIWFWFYPETSACVMRTIYTKVYFNSTDTNCGIADDWLIILERLADSDINEHGCNISQKFYFNIQYMSVWISCGWKNSQSQILRPAAQRQCNRGGRATGSEPWKTWAEKGNYLCFSSCRNVASFGNKKHSGLILSKLVSSIIKLNPTVCPVPRFPLLAKYVINAIMLFCGVSRLHANG